MSCGSLLSGTDILVLVNFSLTVLRFQSFELTSPSSQTNSAISSLKGENLIFVFHQSIL